MPAMVAPTSLFYAFGVNNSANVVGFAKGSELKPLKSSELNYEP
jgi:hypothetical protein